MRAYTVPAAAVALRVPSKWIDNLLARHRIAGVPRGRQGLQRRLGPEALLRVAVTRLLVRDLGLPVGRAVILAERACESRRGDVTPSPHLALRVDLAALEQELTDCLVDGAHMLAAPRRGRPVRRR